MSNLSRPSVHPFDIEVPQLREAGIVDDTVRMKDIQGTPGTQAGLALRLIQFVFAAVSVAVVIATATDFPPVIPYRWFFIVAMSLQCVWSFSLVILDVYALLVKRSLSNLTLVVFFSLGDSIVATLAFYAALLLSAYIRMRGLKNYSRNQYSRFQTSSVMAFVSYFWAVSLIFFNLCWSA